MQSNSSVSACVFCTQHKMWWNENMTWSRVFHRCFFFVIIPFLEWYSQSEQYEFILHQFSQPLFCMHEFVCLDIVLNLVFMKFNAKRLWASTIRMLSYSCLPVFLCVVYSHLYLLCMPRFCFAHTHEREKERKK